MRIDVEKGPIRRRAIRPQEGARGYILERLRFHLAPEKTEQAINCFYLIVFLLLRGGGNLYLFLHSFAYRNLATKDRQRVNSLRTATFISRYKTDGI